MSRNKPRTTATQSNNMSPTKPPTKATRSNNMSPNKPTIKPPQYLQHVTDQTTLVTAHITSESALTREQLTRLKTKLSKQLATAFESETFKRVVQQFFAVSASELCENIRDTVESGISNLQTQLTTTSTVSTTRETETRQHLQQLEQSVTNLCANINTLDLNTTTSIANVGLSVANIDALDAEVGASLHQLVLSKKTPWLFFINKELTSGFKNVYRVHLLCNATKHSPPHFLFKSMKESEHWCRGFKLTELKLLSKYALKAALSMLSLVVATSVASTVPALLAFMPGLTKLLSDVSAKAINDTVTKHVQDLMEDLQQMIPTLRMTLLNTYTSYRLGLTRSRLHKLETPQSHHSRLRVTHNNTM